VPERSAPIGPWTSCDALSDARHAEGERTVGYFRLRDIHAHTGNDTLSTLLGSSVNFYPRAALSSCSLPGTTFYLSQTGREFILDNLTNEQEGYLAVQFGRGPNEVFYGGKVLFLVVAFLCPPTPAEIIDAMTREELP
jgi:hypothetical protein